MLPSVAILALMTLYALSWAGVSWIVSRALAWPQEQRDMLVDLLHYLYVAPGVLVGLLLSPTPLAWTENGTRLLLVIFMATPGFFAFRVIESLFRSPEESPGFMFHHAAFLAVLLSGLLAGFFPYLFLWLSLQQATGITYNLHALLRARKRSTRVSGVVHFFHFLLWRVLLVTSGAVVAGSIAMESWASPSIFWHGIVPAGFLVNLSLNYRWFSQSFHLLRRPAADAM